MVCSLSPLILVELHMNTFSLRVFVLLLSCAASSHYVKVRTCTNKTINVSAVVMMETQILKSENFGIGTGYSNFHQILQNLEKMSTRSFLYHSISDSFINSSHISRSISCKSLSRYARFDVFTFFKIFS